MHGSITPFGLASQDSMYNARTVDWHDDLHLALIGISDLTNRFDVDARLIAGSGVKLDRALLPLLSRIGLNDEMSTVELANLVGRDHSTVSRQVAKLEELGLIERRTKADDRRIRYLAPSAAGAELLAHVDTVRRAWMDEQFRDWASAERDHFVGMLSRLVKGFPNFGELD